MFLDDFLPGLKWSALLGLTGLGVCLADNGLRTEPRQLNAVETKSIGADECNTLFAEVHKDDDFSVSVFDALIDPSKVNRLSRWSINSNSVSNCDEGGLLRKGSINLHLARNESESFQLMIEFDSEDIDKIAGVEVTNLREKNTGESISNSNLEISKLGFVF